MHLSHHFKWLLFLLYFIGIFLLTNGMWSNKEKNPFNDLEKAEIELESPPKYADPLKHAEDPPPTPLKSSSTHASNSLPKLVDEELEIANYISRFLKNPEFIQPSEFEGDVVLHVASKHPPKQNKWKEMARKVKQRTLDYMKNSQANGAEQGDNGDDGKWLESKDEMLGPLIDVVHRLMTQSFPEKYYELRRELEHKIPEGGCRFSLAPDERTFHYAFLFKLATTYSQKEVREGVKDLKTPDFMKQVYKEEEEGAQMSPDHTILDINKLQEASGANNYRAPVDDDEDDEEENKAKLAEYTLMEAIQKGRNAFGKNAIMDWSKMPEFDPLEAMLDEGAWAKSELFLCKRLLKLLKGTSAYRDYVINKNPPKVLEDEEEEEDLGKKVDEAVEEEEKVSKEAKAQAKKEAEAEEEEEEHNSETDSLLWRTDEQATKHAQQQDAIIDIPEENPGLPVEQNFVGTWITSWINAETIEALVKDLEIYIAQQHKNLGITEAYAKWKDWTKLQERKKDWEDRRTKGKLTLKEKIRERWQTHTGLRKIIPWFKMSPEAEKKKEEEMALLWAEWSDKFAAERKAIIHDPVEKIRKQRVHPFDFLQRVKFRIDAQAVKPKKADGENALNICKRIGDEIIMRALYDSPSEVAMDLRGRLGAQILFSVFNGKKWTRDLGVGMFASFVWSVGAGAFFDLFAWVKVLKAMEKYNPKVKGKVTLPGTRPQVNHYVTDPMDLALKSFSSFIVETGDSMVVGRMAGMVLGGKFFASLKVMIDTLIDAFKSGVVAMFGSVANNYVIRFSKLFIFPLQILTTVISTATSAAMVPIQFNKARRNMVSALLLKIRDGFFPPLEEKELKENSKLAKTLKRVSLNADFNTLDEKLQGRVIDNAVNARLAFATGIGKSTGMLMRSMGVGAIISILFGFVPGFPWAGKKRRFLPKSGVNVLDLVVFQPTEAYSMNYQFVGANFIGHESIQRFLSTDINKYKQTVTLILKKTKKQMGQTDEKGQKDEKDQKDEENQKEEKGHHELVPITIGELSQIYHTWFGRIPFHLGRFITYTINFFVTLFGAKWYNENKINNASLFEGHYVLRVSQAEAIRIRDEFVHKLNANAWDVSAVIGHNLESFKTSLKRFADGKKPSKELITFYDEIWKVIQSETHILHHDAELVQMQKVCLFRSMLELLNKLGDETVLEWSKTPSHGKYAHTKKAIQELINAKGALPHPPAHHGQGKNAVVNTYQELYAKYESEHVNGKIVVQITDLLQQEEAKADEKLEETYKNVPEAKNEL